MESEIVDHSINLIAAIAEGNIERVRLAVESGADINVIFELTEDDVNKIKQRMSGRHMATISVGSDTEDENSSCEGSDTEDENSSHESCNAQDGNDYDRYIVHAFH